jgi:hydrogenase maturation protease
MSADPSHAGLRKSMAPTAITPPPAIAQPVRSTLVMGVGNTLQGDDGVGVHAIRALEAHVDAWPGLRLYDAGTLGTTLLVEVEQAEHLIAIDAMRMGAAAGTVRCFVDRDMDHWMRRGKAGSVHEVGLSELLDLSRLRDRLPRHRALVGVEPAYIGWGDSLSDELAGSLDEVKRIVFDLLRGWHEEEA